MQRRPPYFVRVVFEKVTHHKQTTCSRWHLYAMDGSVDANDARMGRILHMLGNNSVRLERLLHRVAGRVKKTPGSAHCAKVGKLAYAQTNCASEKISKKVSCNMMVMTSQLRNVFFFSAPCVAPLGSKPESIKPLVSSFLTLVAFAQLCSLSIQNTASQFWHNKKKIDTVLANNECAKY